MSATINKLNYLEIKLTFFGGVVGFILYYLLKFLLEIEFSYWFVLGPILIVVQIYMFFQFKRREVLHYFVNRFLAWLAVWSFIIFLVYVVSSM